MYMAHMIKQVHFSNRTKFSLKKVWPLKGIVLAGGTGTRLLPLTKLINKHLLPVGKHPMIYYAIAKMRQAGIRDILIVMGKQSAGLYLNYLGGGGAYDVRLTYRVQEHAGGIADALALAEGFVADGEKAVVILGDNLFQDSLVDYMRGFEAQQEGAMVLLKEVCDPRRFGVPKFADDAPNRIARIEEKPASPQSSYCVTGIYFYDSRVFERIRSIKPSQRGELEITDVNNAYARAGQLSHRTLQGWWLDAGTHESLQEAALRIREEDAHD